MFVVVQLERVWLLRSEILRKNLVSTEASHLRLCLRAPEPSGLASFEDHANCRVCQPGVRIEVCR